MTRRARTADSNDQRRPNVIVQVTVGFVSAAAVLVWLLVFGGPDSSDSVSPVEPAANTASSTEPSQAATGSQLAAGTETATGRVDPVDQLTPSGGRVVRADDGSAAVERAVLAVELSDDWLYASPAALEASMRSVFASQHYDLLRSRVLDEGVGLMRTALATAPSQEPTWFFTQALSAALIEMTATTATVQVWEVSVFSREQISEPNATWTLHDVELVLESAQWMVSGWQSNPGPAPQVDVRQSAATAAELNAELFVHRRVGVTDFEATTVAESGG